MCDVFRASSKGTQLNMYWLMLVGRILFGAGNGSITIVQNKIIAFWFDGKELAMAFGFTLAFSRLGSVMNFLFTAQFAEEYGLHITLWAGTALCSLGFMSAFVVSALDTRGCRQLNKAHEVAAAAKKMRFTDIRYFGAKYWFLALTTMFFCKRGHLSPLFLLSSVAFAPKSPVQTQRCGRCGGAVPASQCFLFTFADTCGGRMPSRQRHLPVYGHRERVHASQLRQDGDGGKPDCRMCLLHEHGS